MQNMIRIHVQFVEIINTCLLLNVKTVRKIIVKSVLKYVVMEATN